MKLYDGASSLLMIVTVPIWVPALALYLAIGVLMAPYAIVETLHYAGQADERAAAMQAQAQERLGRRLVLQFVRDWQRRADPQHAATRWYSWYADDNAITQQEEP